MSNRDRGVIWGMMLAGAAAFALLPGAARADVVFPPPATCPDGTEPGTCHGGPHCRPLICATNTDCQGGAVCMDRPFCVHTISCAGKLPPDADPSMYDQQVAEAACPGNSACDAGATCSTLKVCVPTAVSGSSSNGSGETSSSGGSTGVLVGGCACRTAGAQPGAAELPLLAIGALGLGLRARRRRDQRSFVSRQRRA